MRRIRGYGIPKLRMPKLGKPRLGRMPLPRGTGGAHSSKKGKKGYTRREKHPDNSYQFAESLGKRYLSHFNPAQFCPACGELLVHDRTRYKCKKCHYFEKSNIWEKS